MSAPTVTTSWTSGQTLTASALNTNFSDLITYLTNRNSASASWDSLAVSGNTALTGTLTVTGASTLTGGIANLLGYRRPVLKFISVTTVDVENNTGTSNQTTIMFPDGTIRSVTEDTSSTNKYRRFLITAAAEFTSGTEDSGIRSGITEATNTWYAIYAVKSTINTANFVLSGDTTLPIQANFSTLNSRYGTNGWVYLGMIRNGDAALATGDILSFTQAGNITLFRNICDGADLSQFGIRLSNSSSTNLSEYTYVAGASGAVIPNTITLCNYAGQIDSPTSYVRVRGQVQAAYLMSLGVASPTIVNVWFPAADGIQIATTGSTTCQTFLHGFVDGALGVGTNPVL